LSLVNEIARLSLKADAHRYLLGYVWWILEPFLWVSVFYIVFGILLGGDRADFLAFLMVGKLTFIWFSKSVSQAATSLTGNKDLIGKMDSPKWLFPIAVCHENLYKQAIVFLLLIGLLTFNSFQPNVIWLWLIPLALAQYLLILACAMTAALLVCVRHDFQFLVQLGMVFLLFMSGIFWDFTQITNPAIRGHLFLLNPMASLIDMYRNVLMAGIQPAVGQWCVVVSQAVFLLLLIAFMYQRLHYWIARKVLTQ
jgi:lipopolysaccharide transport system permease protein